MPQKGENKLADSIERAAKKVEEHLAQSQENTKNTIIKAAGLIAETLKRDLEHKNTLQDQQNPDNRKMNLGHFTKVVTSESKNQSNRQK